MRSSFVLCSAAMIGLAVPSFAFAQTPKAPAKAASAGPENRYFASLGDILGDLPVDAFIKEIRQGGKVTSTTLDVCYSVAADSDRKDRFAIELKADGQKLTGTGESLEDKSPVTVNLTRKPVDKAVTFEGKITVGQHASLVSSTDNTDSDEKEFQQTQTVDDNLTVAPENFTEVSPQSVAIKVKREAFVELLKGMRNDNVQVSLDSLTTDCVALRTGLQIVRLTIDPARAPALVAKWKATSGVAAAGWTSGSYDMERAVRVAASDWRSGDQLNKDKLAAAISSSVGKALGAQTAASKWNDTTGELTFSVKRPNTSVPALNLTDTLEFTALAGPEKLGASDKMIIWIGTPSTTTKDESAGPHLELSEAANGDEESSFADDDGAVKALASGLNGQRWDSDKSSWK